MHKYSVLLYYCYTHLAFPDSFRAKQQALCDSLGLRGRLLVASEGLNGTLSGPTEACKAYIASLQADPRMANMEMKMAPCKGHVFARLHVRLRSEIVHSGLPDLQPVNSAATYVSANTLRKWMLKPDPDVLLLDARSDYEHLLGKFKGAYTFPIKYYRSVFGHTSELRAHRDKKIVTYCTGGIRCEKLTTYLRQKGFRQVYQLKGGILRYGMETDGTGFEGLCYVFDRRIKVEVNRHSPSVISRCVRCGILSARMVNCAHTLCNRQCVLCTACAETHAGTCSDACRSQPGLRPYNQTGYYAR